MINERKTVPHSKYHNKRFQGNLQYLNNRYNKINQKNNNNTKLTILTSFLIDKHSKKIQMLTNKI